MSSTRSYRPGAVLVYDGPTGAVIATVVAGPYYDGTYDLDKDKSVPSDKLGQITGGLAVEYYSSSLGAWIPAQVLRKGADPGTFDLDRKNGVDVSRMRLPAKAQPSAPSRKPSKGGVPPKEVKEQDAMDDSVALAETLQVRSAAGQAVRAPCLGEHCFYKSATHGWIPAKVVNVNDNGTFDLNVKELVALENLRCIWEGDLVEYKSSAMGWIPAFVKRPGKVEGTFDLDCKDGAEAHRIRPPSPEADHVAVVRRALLEATKGEDIQALRAALSAARKAGLPARDVECGDKAVAALEQRSTGGYCKAPSSAAARSDATTACSPQTRRSTVTSPTPPALLELRRAAASGDILALQKALVEAERAGVSNNELETASSILRALAAPIDEDRCHALQHAPTQAAVPDDPRMLGGALETCQTEADLHVPTPPGTARGTQPKIAPEPLSPRSAAMWRQRCLAAQAPTPGKAWVREQGSPPAAQHGAQSEPVSQFRSNLETLVVGAGPPPQPAHQSTPDHGILTWLLSSLGLDLGNSCGAQAVQSCQRETCPASTQSSSEATRKAWKDHPSEAFGPGAGVYDVMQESMGNNFDAYPGGLQAASPSRNGFRIDV
eukprot:TRINITY_DN50770_c0_g1_i1.p1 TRINITY_DN50770_c0_g1~~TRINITY_DN50770_c0_g1_i1.p1  ORF type:complete len:605 (-),score=124.74 TRINITY_DN50770_c0_g1_i1:330-2144(-)